MYLYSIASIMIGLMTPISVLFMLTVFHKEDEEFLFKIFFFSISGILYVASVLYLLINVRDYVSLIWLGFSLMSIVVSIAFFCIRGFLHPSSKTDDKVQFRLGMIPLTLGWVTSMVPNHLARVCKISEGKYILAIVFYALTYFMPIVGIICDSTYERSKKAITRFLAGAGIACAIIATLLCGLASYCYLVDGTTIWGCGLRIK